jgi:hypothetical protein
VQGRFSSNGPKLLSFGHFRVHDTMDRLPLARLHRANCSALVPAVMQFAQSVSMEGE